MRTRPTTPTILSRLAAAAVVTALLAACGGQTDGRTDPGGPADPVTGERGWLGGEPDFDGGPDTGGEMSMDSAAGGAPLAAEAPAPSRSGADESGRPSGPPRAGSVDDNADYAAYLGYARRIAGLELPLRDFDARGRVLVTVTGSDGRPAAGEPVVVSSGGEEVATVRTTADGTARFLPGVAGAPVDGTFTVTVGGTSTDVAAGESAELAVDRPGGLATAADDVPLDVLFLLDATGSMGDEIDQLKTSVDSIATRVAELEGAPDVRFAMTVYRDRGDAFVTRTFDFTEDVEAFRAALAEVRADGGGDYPEALEEALSEALTEPAWRPAGEAVPLVFLVADAPPQTRRQLGTTYPEAAREAAARGIKIFPVASSESDDTAEAVFRQLALATGARFVFLSYGAGGAATGDHTDIDATDYEELALDDLVVRLTAEEVAALTGDPDIVPTPTPTDDPTQVDDQQQR